MSIVPYLRCYDCRLHVIDALDAQKHRQETSHAQWTSIDHDLHVVEGSPS